MAGFLLGSGHEEVLGPELLESQHLIYMQNKMNALRVIWISMSKKPTLNFPKESR